jgi:hypothetical protein
MPFPFLVQLLIGVGLNILGYLLMPKPPQPKPPELSDLNEPTVEAGRPIPVLFGSMTIEGLNIIWMGDKAISTRKANSGGKK